MESYFNPRQVERWTEAVEREMAVLQQKLDPLLEERARLEGRRDLLQSLLASFDEAGGDQPQPSESQPQRPATQTREPVRQYVEKRVLEILDEAGEPLHINDIHRRFREKGYRIPGAGKPVNITSHIRLSERIRSPERGIYGTVEQVGDISRGASKKRKRRPAKK